MREVAMPFDQQENLRDAILKKKARIAEIERILDRPPLTEYRGRPVHGGQNRRLRLEEERQLLLVAVAELERLDGGRTLDTPASVSQAVGAVRPDANTMMKPFDEDLYTRKLQEPCNRMHRETQLRRGHAQAKHAKHGQGLGTTFLVRQIDSDLGVLRDVFLPDVDRVCRETWLSDHEAIAP
jgi:hypothetical protein